MSTPAFDLAVLMNLFPLLLVGWAAGPTIHCELVLDAALSAARRRDLATR